jgi:hypothetical protein
MALASSIASKAAAAAVASDRRWFYRHPEALIRFRPIRRGEFAALERLDEVPPAYVPGPLRGRHSLTWVAVVDLTRCLREQIEDPELSLRVRLATVPLRSKKLQSTWAPVYINAILRDLLYQMELWGDDSESQVA